MTTACRYTRIDAMHLIGTHLVQCFQVQIEQIVNALNS
jgi:hypothetical protein